MIKAKQVFFWTSNLKGHSFHGDKANILSLTLKCYSLCVLYEKIYIRQISQIFSSDWEDTLKRETPSSPTRNNFKW